MKLFLHKDREYKAIASNSRRFNRQIRSALHNSEKQRLYYKWDWQLSSDATALWPLISDANRLYKDLSRPAMQPTDFSNEIQKGRLQLSYVSKKHSDTWVEEPFEWEYPFRYSVLRIYKNGPYRQMRIRVDLFPNQRGTRVQYQVWTVPRNNILSYLLAVRLNFLLRRRLKSIFSHYDLLVRDHRLPYQDQSSHQLVRGGASRLADITHSLISQTGKEEIVEQLVNFIRQADDIDLIRIEPYSLADHWNRDRKDVLQVFLYAVEKGLLNFNWDLYCPTCRMVQQTCKTLNDVHETVYCTKCSKYFVINFNKSVQLSFRPNPLIRKVSMENYSMGGPQSKPHVIIQQLIKPGHKRYLKTKLSKGTYYLRTEHATGHVALIANEGGRNTVSIRLTSHGLSGEVDIATEPNLIFVNSTSEEQLFTLEKASWSENNLTAAQVTSYQLFRDLFGEEVLSKGEKIAVDKLTLMFTDLFDSTKLYHQEGDSEALGQVIEHFDVLQKAVAKEDGALVKTIGDSIMAVFSNPAQALNAFVNAQRTIAGDKRFGTSLKLKAGIHYGSCVAVNLNNRIDYFGSTVNIASRLVDLADENEVIVSKAVSENPLFRQVLNRKYSNYFTKNECAHLKGFDSHVFNIERIQLQKHNLRLVI